MVALKHDGEVGFKQSTAWGFYSTAKETTDKASEAKLSSQPVEDWLKTKTADPVKPEVTEIE
jgi:hypothetical protein